VLGLSIRDQYVERPTGGVGDRFRLPSVPGAAPGWAPDGGPLAVAEGVRQVREPVRVGPRVVVDVGDDVAGRRAQSGVASLREADVVRTGSA
jgi:hypothetical protein